VPATHTIFTPLNAEDPNFFIFLGTSDAARGYSGVT